MLASLIVSIIIGLLAGYLVNTLAAYLPSQTGKTAPSFQAALAYSYKNKRAWYEVLALLLCLMAAIACVFSPLPYLVTGALYLFFCFALTLSIIDFRTQLLPDKLTLPLLWLGLLFNTLSGLIELSDAVYGAVAGYGVLWCVYWGVWFISHKEGLGYGDFKLLAAAGAWCGWQALPSILLLASLSGLFYAICLRLCRGKVITTLAFGPWLAASSMISLSYLVWVTY